MNRMLIADTLELNKTKVSRFGHGQEPWIIEFKRNGARTIR
jgi:hypothetical protein